MRGARSCTDYGTMSVTDGGLSEGGLLLGGLALAGIFLLVAFLIFEFIRDLSKSDVEREKDIEKASPNCVAERVAALKNMIHPHI